MSNDKVIKELQEAGAHFGYSKSKRHPSAEKYILGRKDLRDIFDLAQTASALEEAKKMIKDTLDKKMTVLFVGTKNEARKAIEEVAQGVGQPFVNLRYIGGTITNFSEIKKRIARLKDLTAKFESGNLDAYTKKERLMLKREMEKLQEKFGGVVNLERLPSLVVVVDHGHESIVTKEAKDKGIPVISIASSDNNFNEVDLAIPANDSSVKSIRYILNYIVN